MNKLRFFLGVLMTFVGIGIQAANWTTSSLTDGEKYVLRNVGSGRYFGGSNTWGTQASLIPSTQFNIIHAFNDGYSIETNFNGRAGCYFNGSYMDHEPTLVYIHDNGAGVYTLSNGTTYYGYDGSSTVLASNLTNADDVNAQWQIVPCDAFLRQATMSNPVDATFLILDANFDRGNRYGIGEYADKGCAWTMAASNQNLSGGKDENCCAESWKSAFTLSQVINVPNGRYKLRAQAAYTEYTTTGANLPVIYANEATVQFKPMTLNENSMDDISVAFSAGRYFTDYTDYITVTDGKITVGARGTRTDTWAIWDNFQLVYYGPVTQSEEPTAVGTISLETGGNVSLTPGGQTTLQVSLNTSGKSYRAVLFSLTLPTGVTTVDDELGNPQVTADPALASAGYEALAVRQNDGNIRFAVVNTTSATVIPAGCSSLLSFTIVGASNITSNTLTATLSGIKLTDNSHTDHAMGNVTFSINTSEEVEGVPGDVNGDGSVDIGDIVMVISVMTGSETRADIVAAADVNGDGAGDIGDIVAIIDIMTSQTAGVRSSSALRAPRLAGGDRMDASLIGNDLQLSLTNGREYSAFQLMLTLPEGTTLDEVAMNRDRGGKHCIAVRPLGDGQYLVMGYSLGGQPLRGYEGQLLTISTTGVEPLSAVVSGVVMANVKGATFHLNGCEANQGVATGINGMANAGMTDASCYDLQGRSVGNAQLRKGVYVINGKKIVVK